MQSTSTLFDYNLSGNITACHIFPYWAGCPTFPYRSLIGCDPSYEVVNYGYSNGAWGDLLTSYIGTTITYDAIGNPTKWRDGITNVTWNGRQLNSLVKGNYTYSYQYNADGIRTQKTKCYTGTSMAEITHYVLDGTKIVKEYRTTSANSTQTNVKYYFYDVSGNIAGFEYNGNKYYFQKNIQGDIIRICDTSGNTVAEYTYDAWGKILSIKDGSGNDVSGNASHIANINPFRYRGYYYDSETGFYYLQTRYYDPEVGRFLNADGYIGANGNIPGYNMFSYCNNNPVVCNDPSGEFLGWLIGGIAGAIGGAISAVIEGKTGDEFWGSVAGGATSGAIAGLATDIIVCTGGTGAAVVATYAICGAFGDFSGSLVDSAVSGRDMSSFEVWKDAIVSGVEGGIFGAVSGLIAGPSKSLMKEATASAGAKRLAKGVTVGYAVKKAIKKELKSFVKDAAVGVIEGTTQWYAETVFEHSAKRIWRDILEK